MNLQDTVKALEAKGVTIALNIGVHRSCRLDSNCPIAIELRRIIADAGITLEQLLEGHQEVTAPDPVSSSLPQFNASVSISIAGKVLEVDFNDIISRELKARTDQKLADLDRLNRNVRELGHDLYLSYLTEIQKQRDSQHLPQLDFSIAQLVGTGCLVTAAGKEYIFLFPSTYNPQYIVRDGIRYKLLDKDIENIKRGMYLKLIVAQGGSIRRVDVLDTEGRKLQHYHGNEREDCWGSIPLLKKWDRGLESLSKLVHLLTISLMTINHDSMVQGNPLGMPDADDLMDRSTKLGREGEIKAQEHTEEDTTRRGWGRTAWGRRE